MQPDLHERTEVTEPLFADRIGMARLAKIAFDGGNLRPMWAELIAKLLDGTADAGEGLDLSLIAQLLGDKQTGLAIQYEMLTSHQLFRSPCVAKQPRLRVLALAAATDMGSNTPIEFLLEESGIELLMLYVIPEVGLPAALPDHDVAIVIASDSEECRDALEIIEQAAARWPRHVTLAVDLFPGQLKDLNLKAQVVKALEESGVAAQRLEIEITESALVADLEGAQRALGGLREAGVRIALDNFGTGYSSLYHLRNFKLDKIKIDKSFVESMSTTRESAAIVSALIGLGEGFGLTIAAEGIDNTQQQAELLRTGCEQGQGHLYSDPLTADATTAFFAPPVLRSIAQA